MTRAPDATVERRTGTPRGPRSTGRATLAVLGLWFRMVRAEPLLALGAAVVVALAAVLLAGGARLLGQVSTDDLRRATDEGLAEDRTVSHEVDTRIGAGPTGDRFALVDRRGQAFRDRLAPEVEAVLGPRQFVVESAPFRVSSFPDQDDGPFVLSFRFRHHQDVADQVRLVDGALPGAADPIPLLLGTDCPVDPTAVDRFERDRSRDCREVAVPVHQVALTAQMADDLLVDVGQRVILRPDAVHSDWRFVFGQSLEARIVLEVSGIIELTDQLDDYWYGDPSLHRARVFENADLRLVDGAGLIDPDSYARLLRDTLGPPYHYTWRFPVVAERLETDDVGPLLTEADRIESPDGRVVTQLPGLLIDHLAQRTQTVSLLSTVFAGVVALAGAAVWVLTELAMDRQRASWRLALERGAGRDRLLAASAFHGLAVAVPAAVVGWAVTVAVLPEVPAGIGAGPVVVLAIGTAGATVGAAAVAVGRRTGAGGRVAVDRVERTRARRLVGDGLVVALAVGAAFLVERRADGGRTEVDGDLDRLLAVTPVVTAMAVAVLTLRLLGPLLTLASAGPQRARGAVAFLGLRRLVDGRRSARSSVLVTVVAIGLAGFGASLATSMARAQEAQRWQAIGAEAELRSAIRAGMTIDRELVEQAGELGPMAVGAEFPAAELRPRSDEADGSAGGYHVRSAVTAHVGLSQ